MARGAAIPGGIVANAPCANVQAWAQVYVLAAVILLTVLSRAAVAGIGAVIKQARSDPFVKLFRVNVTARHLAQRRLRDAHQQLLVANAKGGGCSRNDM